MIERGGPMKSKQRKIVKKRKTSKKRSAKKTTRRRVPMKRRVAKRNRVPHTNKVALNPREAEVQRRVFRVLRRMREGNESLSKATRLEGIKSKTFVRYARRALRRNGPGKPWKAIPEDKLAAVMNVITKFGAVPEVVHGLRERKLLGGYNLTVRMVRAGEDGAEAALKKYRGKKVAGHTLITDIPVLIRLEEAGKLDFDDLYSSLGEES
jgi:hypothetical protein